MRDIHGVYPMLNKLGHRSSHLHVLKIGEGLPPAWVVSIGRRSQTLPSLEALGIVMKKCTKE